MAARERATEWLVVRSAVFVLLAGLVVLVAALLAWRLRVTILLLLVSLFIAVLLNPFVRMLCRRGLGRVNAVFVVYGVLVVVALAFGYLLFHPLVSSASRFAHDLPALVRDAQHGRGPVGRLVARLHLESWVRRNVPNLESAIAKLSKPAFAVGRTVVSGIVGLVTIAFVSFFVLLEGPRTFGGALGLMTEEHAAATSPDHRRHVPRGDRLHDRRPRHLGHRRGGRVRDPRGDPRALRPAPRGLGRAGRLLAAHRGTARRGADGRRWPSSTRRWRGS